MHAYVVAEFWVIFVMELCVIFLHVIVCIHALNMFMQLCMHAAMPINTHAVNGQTKTGLNCGQCCRDRPI